MSDAIGKALGKRVLMEDGTWISVKSLPKDVQDEMSNNSKIADAQRRDKALANSTDFNKKKDNKIEAALRAENNELKDMVRAQGEMLATINAKMELGAAVAKPARMATGAELKTATPKPRKPTKKESLQAQCEDKGLEFEDSNTIAELEELITEAELDEFDQAAEA